MTGAAQGLRANGRNGVGALVLRGGLAGLALRVIAAPLGLLLSVVLARTMGPDNFGAYAFAFALVMSLALPLQVGLPALAVRETARAVAAEDWPLLRGFWRFCALTVLSGTLVLWLGAGLWWLAVGAPASDGATLLLTGMLLLPLIALSGLRDAALQGLRRIFLGQVSDSVLRPALLCLVVLAGAAAAGRPLSAATVMVLHLAVAVVVFVFGAVALAMARPPALKQPGAAVMTPGPWIAAMLPLALLGGVQILRETSGLLILGALRSDAEVGAFRIALSLSTLAYLGQSAFTMAAQPYLVSLHHAGDAAGFGRVAAGLSVAGTCLMLPILLLFWLAGDQVIFRLFGPGFDSASGALSVLMLGGVALGVLGTSGSLLTATGHEKAALRANLAGVGAVLVLSVVAIPAGGPVGAAAAVSCGLVLSEVMKVRLVRQLVGVDLSPRTSLRTFVALARTWQRRRP